MLLRTSSYVIYVPLPNVQDGKDTLLVHGYSGAYDRVTQNVVRYLKDREPKRATQMPDLKLCPSVESECPNVETLAALRRKGYLTTLTVEEEEDLFKRFAKVLFKKSGAEPIFVLIPTYDCNLRCPYCFQGSVRSSLQECQSAQVMSHEMVDRIFAAMRGITQDLGADTNLIPQRITLFGGEPLLRRSRATVDYILDKAREIGTPSFDVITNGTQMDAYADLLGNGLSRIQFTLDGIPEIHDTRRIYPNGAGSFEDIASNINLALDRGVHVRVRVNVDRSNLDQLALLEEVLKTRGWSNRSNFRAYAAPIVVASTGIDSKNVFGTLELDAEISKSRQQNNRLVQIDRPDEGIIASARRIFEGAKQGYSQYRGSYCGAHSSMYVFDLFGDVYACMEQTGEPELRMGHVERDGSISSNTAVLSRWRGRTSASNSVCSKCKYGLFCGGGCALRAAESSGSFESHACDGFAARFKTHVVEAYLDHLLGKMTPMPLPVCGQ
jgi:uncharacterized protein